MAFNLAKPPSLRTSLDMAKTDGGMFECSVSLSAAGKFKDRNVLNTGEKKVWFHKYINSDKNIYNDNQLPVTNVYQFVKSR